MGTTVVTSTVQTTTEPTTTVQTTTVVTTTEEPTTTVLTTTVVTTTEEPTTTVLTTTDLTSTVQTTTVQTTTEQTTTDAGGDCTIDDFEADDNGNCFLVVTTKLTWAKAKAKCKTLGSAALATINDAKANTFIKGKLSANAWTGATDVTNGGTWKWINGDAWGSFTKWKDSTDDDDKDCAYIYKANGKWQDEDCAKKMHYVCMET